MTLWKCRQYFSHYALPMHRWCCQESFSVIKSYLISICLVLAWNTEIPFGSWDDCVCAYVCACVCIWFPSSSALHFVLQCFNPIETPNSLGTYTSTAFIVLYVKKSTAPPTCMASSTEETSFVEKHSKAFPFSTDTILTTLANDSNCWR